MRRTVLSEGLLVVQSSPFNVKNVVGCAVKLMKVLILLQERMQGSSLTNLPTSIML